MGNRRKTKEERLRQTTRSRNHSVTYARKKKATEELEKISLLKQYASFADGNLKENQKDDD